MLNIYQATLSFPDTETKERKPLFPPLTLSVPEENVCLISAPSGAGKSTLLRWVAGMPTQDLSSHGTIVLAGHDITNLPPEKRHIGILFQTPLLFPHLCVADNIGFGIPRTYRGMARRMLIEDALKNAGLAGLSKRDPETLSGGQQSRVALLRTLLAEPQALLLDEPFSSLDDEARQKSITLLRAEITKRKLPVLLVSHDPRDRDLADLPVIYLAEHTS